MLKSLAPSPAIRALLSELSGKRLVVLTTHRRESFGRPMQENLRVLRRFVERHEDMVAVFSGSSQSRCSAGERQSVGGFNRRVRLLEPLDYPDFLHLLQCAWLVVSDSGGVQEEAPSLGKPLLILRDNTERPEAVDCGVARLVGGSPRRLAKMLEAIVDDDSWLRSVSQVENPFGSGDSADRIVDAIEVFLNLSARMAERNRERVLP